ncbi:type IV secretion system protein [Wolbachia endosymbiont of Diaphorina citri]|jgi:Type IV secretory pathway, VirB6 components|uniref:type IV secretion system protein n=1 Tax=Wolbachia endosymbiont of Diaphorina citri TaxID=116598 RepID=UPI0003154E1A|nr:type IV secretion system protein [Wolbachia endosymbiont of Diaphorina citri]QJT94631.1 type IV secretion system protein [Wolbachia endosymbiont of Diaphorina citri]QJT95870.1 type IV secretion system protein [Wolbachia endosymbiont of Diaphorina citri]QJT97232.1 type IV secretion system protein [Wolbachia endosymbiont of Diaphorina citri]QLK11528.1 conjugal transfer protein TrbL [Wolbachia endosymbiont of Diaphorina citri]QXY86939.1 conjugal transfer protein TrbL [Wolbachia endosymbiont of
MMSRKSLLLILCLVITGCTMDCVEPGLQSRNTSVSIDVPVREAGEGVKIHWVDSGQVISKDEKIKFTLGGSVNLCPLKEGKNPKRVLVPAVFCANDLIPNYSNKLTDNTSLDEREICGDIGFGNNEFYSNRRYVDTGIKANPGDKLSFSLIPREITIDYDNPQGRGISFDDNCYRTERGDEKDKVTIKDMFGGGTFFCGEIGKRTKVEFPLLSKEKMKVLVGNGYTPYDNKVHFNDKSPWMNGALLDLRRTKIGLNELCNGKRCDFNELNKYSSYELNCYYQNICYNAKGIGEDCVSSIRYEKYDERNTCDMYSHLKGIEDELKKIEENKRDSKQIDINLISNSKLNFKENRGDISWAEALVAKVGDLDNQNTAKGIQCFPNEKGAEGDNVCSQINYKFEDYSLRLNHYYTVNNNVVPDKNSLMLAIADYGNYGANRGGYYVEVTRSCNFDSGKKLYMHLGDNPPLDPFAIKTNDFKEVERLDKIKEDNVVYYAIDGSHLKGKESKKIYFGINVENVKKDDITDKDGKYYENNKYTVTLFVKRKINDFISSNVNEVFKFIKEEVIGDSVKDSYKGYARGLLQGVRALLILYVIFTVIGYMLGTIQLSKFDFIVRMMKIAFIAFAFSDRSWELFGTTLSRLFIDGSTYLVDSFSGYIGEGGKKFAFLDLTAGVLFTGETWLKFLSLMLSGPFGFIAFLAILYATFVFLRCIISATFKYVISTVLVAFLLSLAPLFIVFILFQQTKTLFDNWIKTLAHVSLQPVILFSSLSLLNQLMYSVLYNLTNFSACYQCLISVNFLSYDLCLMKSILPLGYSPGTSVDVALSTGERAGGHFSALPIDLIQAFIYLIIASAMEAFVSISETMAQALFSSGFGVAQSVSHISRSASQAMLSTVGLDDRTQYMIHNIKQGMSKDRSKIEVKLPDTPKQADGKGSAGREMSKSETLSQPDKQKDSDKTKGQVKED